MVMFRLCVSKKATGKLMDVYLLPELTYATTPGDIVSAFALFITRRGFRWPGGI